MTLPHDRQVAAWLADDAHEAPPDSLARALAATRRTRKRPRWTFPERWIPVQPTTFAKLGVTAVAIAAVGLVGLTLLRQPSVGPAPSASPEPSSSPSSSHSAALPMPLTERFDSPLNAISMDYPGGWQVKPATEPWVHGALAFAAPEVDVIFDPTLQDDVYIAIVSEPLDGRRPDDWPSPSVVYPDMCEPGSGGHGAGLGTLDGAKAYFGIMGCIRHGFGGSKLSVVAATATRGYIVNLFVIDARRLKAIYDMDWFDTVLETVELRQEDAP